MKGFKSTLLHVHQSREAEKQTWPDQDLSLLSALDGSSRLVSDCYNPHYGAFDAAGKEPSIPLH